MVSKIDHPGVYIPPPLFFVAAFFAAVYTQQYLPLDGEFFNSSFAGIAGICIIAAGLLFFVPAVYRFVKTKNTLITIRPANTLQTTGIYAITLNPMYVSLVLFYLGLSFVIGNWWSIIFLPLLVFVVQEYIIKREERYLEHHFGEAFVTYKSRVRRWI